MQKRANSKVISFSNKGIVTIDVDEIDEIDEDDDLADSVPSTSTNRQRNTSTV